MNAHPGGEAHTRRMLETAGLAPGKRIIDLGAGAGESVLLMRSLGYDAHGIDLSPRASFVSQGDLLHTALPDAGFDAVLSQCAFFVSGDPEAALAEAHRLLKKGGLLLLSDVFTADPRALLKRAHFSLLHLENLTDRWREYYLEALWRGEPPCEKVHGRVRYYFVLGRREEDGSV